MFIQILTLLIALLGLSMVLGGGKGVRLFFSPLFWGVRICVVAVLVGVIGWAGWTFFTSNRDEIGTLLSGWTLSGADREHAQPAERETGIMLEEYFPLAQRDEANYDPLDLVYRPDPVEPGKTVGDNACLATVYLILERARGNTGGRITSDWFDEKGNVYRPAYVRAEEAFSISETRHELESGRPVILHGGGGGIPSHFLLAVGFVRNGTRMELTALDPWSGERMTLPVMEGSPRLPRWPGHVIYGMRRIK